MGGAPTQTSSSTPTMDPQLKAALMGNIGTADQITGGVLPTQDADGNLVNSDGSAFKAPTSLTAGFTPDQLAAFGQIRNLSGTPLTAAQLGGNTYSALSNFQAPSVNGTVVNGSTVANTAPMAAGTVGDGSNVAAKQFTDYDLSKYTNPAMAQVIDPLTQYFNTQSDRAAAASQSQARASGALRGSNRDIGAALARGEVANQAGAALAPLYEDAYKTGAGLVQNDESLATQAGLANQGMATQRDIAQANLDTTAASNNQNVAANQATTNAQLAQQAGLANQGNALQAGMANQSGALNSAGVQATGAAGLAGANTGAQQNQVQLAQLLSALGGQEQGMDQSKINDLIQALGIRSGAVTGAIPSMTGSTSTTTGGGSGAAGMLGGLGSLASGIGALAAL